jgi:hypothetical protein
MFFWTPDTIRLRPARSSTNHPHQTLIIFITALAAIAFLLLLVYGVLASTTNGQIGRGLRQVHTRSHLKLFSFSLFVVQGG